MVLTVIVALVLAIAIGILVWYLRSMHPANSNGTGTGQPTTSADRSAGLGAQLYDKVQNPVEGKLPDANTPVTNPLNSVYKNPFSN